MSNSESELHHLRELVRLDRSGGSKYRPYPKELKTRLIHFLSEQARDGASVKEVGEELGLNHCTITSWQDRWFPGVKRRKPNSKFKKAEVAPETSKGLSMQGPGGTVVSGLSAEDVALIWRKLS